MLRVGSLAASLWIAVQNDSTKRPVRIGTILWRIDRKLALNSGAVNVASPSSEHEAA
jgi:hypothetical protein